MAEVMDTADQALAHETFDRDLALALTRELNGIKPAELRIVNQFCEECGNEIDPERRAANTATDIVYCIGCQTRWERDSLRYRGP